MRPLVLVLSLLALSACNAVVGVPVGNSDPNELSQAMPEDVVGTPFVLGTEQLRLLPFDVRLRRVAAVAGVDVNDPILEDMRRQRQQLGDYDFAAGVLPDSSWTPTRMAAWIDVLLPVCDSTVFHSRYPELPESLPDLAEAAYGRTASADEINEATEAVSELSDSERYEALCLTVLASAEMVLQ